MEQTKTAKPFKYRVKFKCYWYNTGAADNHYYDNYEDFDTLEEAQAFKRRVDAQKDLFDDYSEGWIDRNEAWKKSDNYVKIENGFIEGYGTIVKYYPEKEEEL